MTEIEKKKIKEIGDIMGKATETNLCHKECFIDTDFYNACSLCRSATAIFNAGYRKVDGNTSDGYHTFNELYHHRAVLFAMICNQNSDIAWKSKKHNDGTMFDGMFIVGVETPQGQATYHYDISPYWDYFKVKELEAAPIWDGHTPSQAIDRIFEMSKNAAGYRKQSETITFYKDPNIKDWAESEYASCERPCDSNMSMRAIDKKGNIVGYASEHYWTWCDVKEVKKVSAIEFMRHFASKQSDTVKEFAEKLLSPLIKAYNQSYKASGYDMEAARSASEIKHYMDHIKQTAEQYGKEEK